MIELLKNRGGDTRCEIDQNRGQGAGAGLTAGLQRLAEQPVMAAVARSGSISEKLGLDPEQILIELEQRQGDKNLPLAFSCGKDSIALWLYMRERGWNVIPFFGDLIPDLSFVNEAIEYFEDFFKTHIIRVTHPSFWRMINHALFQPPGRISVINKYNPPVYNWLDILDAIVEDYGDKLRITKNHYYGLGVRAVDSLNRWASIKRRGAFTHRARKVYPIAHFRKRDVLGIINDHGVKLPVDYEMFGRSFDGIDKRFLEPIKSRFPNDYEKILYWFPLAELELLRG